MLSTSSLYGGWHVRGNQGCLTMLCERWLERQTVNPAPVKGQFMYDRNLKEKNSEFKKRQPNNYKPAVIISTQFLGCKETVP